MGYSSIDNSSSIMRQDNECPQHFEFDRRNDEEIDGYDLLTVIFQECFPRLAAGSVAFAHIFLN